MPWAGHYLAQRQKDRRALGIVVGSDGPLRHLPLPSCVRFEIHLPTPERIAVAVATKAQVGPRVAKIGRFDSHRHRQKKSALTGLQDQPVGASKMELELESQR